MDGILSQDEINALLSGMDLSGSLSDEPAPSFDEPAGNAAAPLEEGLLNETEKDAIGEIANISMGSSATTLYSLVNRKVNITTPVVTMADWNTVIEDYQKPCVFIQIRYTAGLDGSNIMVLKEHDVHVITDLMMGGDGSNVFGELGELQLSAISEAMNQMMGAAATSMSTMLGKMIDISPPEASRIDLREFSTGDDIASFLSGTFVKISFRMQIDDLVDSTLMQLYPLEFARSLYETFISSQEFDATPEPAPAAPQPEPYVPPVAEAPVPDMMQQNMGMPQPDMSQMGMNMGMPQMGMNMGMPQMGIGMGMPQMGMNMGMPMMGMPQPMMQNVNIQPAQFQSFSTPENMMAGQENIGIIRDVPLEVTVELGRTKKSIAEILDFAPGTIIELDKIAGEPIDVLVNGKFVAKGEVVVIEESFGIRVTEIIK
ncbi:MAG: flagellar motor switch phosphatase FliY [Lachnospiraceae bacterium]|nr:flagellar motor switch phosphatase FliY [Lachnospiraceae bacterium]